MHNSQVAISTAIQTSQRVTYLYESMDPVYNAEQIHKYSERMDHVAIIDINPRRDAALKEALYREATAQR